MISNALIGVKNNKSLEKSKERDTSSKYRQEETFDGWTGPEINGRKNKVKNGTKSYRSINNQIMRKIIEAKEQVFKDKYIEIEISQLKHDTFGVYKNIKEIIGKSRPNQ